MSNVVTKTGFVKLVSDKTGQTQNDAATAVDAMIEIITNCLEKGDKVQLTGFGSFSVADRAARTGRNPSTGEPMNIKACRVAKFKPGQELKDAVAAAAEEAA